MRVCGLLKVLAALCAGAFVSASIARAAESYKYDRYQVILERAPFGPVSATEGPGAAPNFATQLQLVALVESNSVLPQAGILDKQANRTYYRAEGESIDDVKVVSIDLTARKVVTQKGLEKATLTFEQRPNTPLPGGAAPAAVPRPVVPGQPRPIAPPGVRRIPFRRGN
jgi:hypothetical protein